MFGLLLLVPAAADPPDASGPYVIRYDESGLGDSMPVWFADEDAGLSMTIGIDNVEFCNGNVVTDVWRIQDIAVPEDANRVNRTLTGRDVRASVWPFTVFDCNLFLTVEPVAVGLVDVKLTDIDVYVFLNPDNYNHNAFGFRAHGLFGRGNPVVGVQNCVWDGNDGTTMRCVSKIQTKR